MSDLQEAGSIRWGILGPGAIAESFVASLRAAPSATCVGVGSRSLERAQRFADKHSVPRAYGSYEELVGDPEIDVIYVATPQSQHHEHGRLALEQGRHVLIEKPMAMSLAETTDLIEAARVRNLFLMEGLWTLCNPLVRTAVTLSRSETYGRLQAFFANCGPIALPIGHRALNASLGGGFYREVLIYPLALWLALTDIAAVADVRALGHSVDNVDVASCVSLRTHDGRIATMGGAFARDVAATAASRAQLLLGSGWVELENIYNPSALRVAIGDRYTEETFDADADGFAHEIAEVADALSQGRLESASVPHALSLELARLLDQVAEQIQ